MHKAPLTAAALAVLCLAAMAQADVFNLGGDLTSLLTVTVGDAGNDPDTRYSTPGFGAVSDSYKIAQFEVTAAQYCEFLNAKAKTDPFGLYNGKMWTDTYGCRIKQEGTDGSYTYTVADDWANRPVNYVRFWDACRFANWLHNGQGDGDTETGAYALNGYNSSGGGNIGRDPAWLWAVAGENEWYKAAYYKGGGLTAGYWDQATQSGTTPSNVLGEPTDPGNNATFRATSPQYTIGSPYYRTEVGDHENSESAYGTLDQAGNVYELTDTVWQTGSSRVTRGGCFSMFGSYMAASNRTNTAPDSEQGWIGFRVVANNNPVSRVDLPKLDPDGGAIVGPLGVTLTCATPSVTIHYTTDGTEPSESSPSVASGETVLVVGPCLLQARAFRSGWVPSPVATAGFYREYAISDFGQTLVSDSFSDDALDSLIWQTVLPPGYPSAVVERDQHLEIVGRGHLRSRNEYDPRARPVLVQGKLRMLNDQDFLSVSIRTDGTIGSYGALYNELRLQIEPWVGGKFTFVATTNGAPTEYTPSMCLSSTNSINGTTTETTFSFAMIDDGLSPWFRVEPISGPGTGFAEGRIWRTETCGRNYIDLYNREMSSCIAHLDDLSVKTIGSCSVMGVKEVEDGTWVDTSGVVTAVFGDQFYIEHPDRLAGIRVYLPGHGLMQGRAVNVRGRVWTDANSERFIEATSAADLGSAVVSPLLMPIFGLGGRDAGFPPLGQEGIPGAVSLNNIGLLVRVCGRVTELDPGTPPDEPCWFRLDDGSGADVRCLADGLDVHTSWTYLGVTGISSCERAEPGGDLFRVLRVRSQSDIVPF